MILRQLAEGRCEVENQYTRVVPVRGQPARAGGRWPRSSSCARTSSGAGSASSPRAGCGSSDAYADLDAERRFEVPGVRVADPKACQCGEVLKGVIKPWECKVFGTACTPGARRSARAWCPRRAPAPPTTTTAASRASGRSSERRPTRRSATARQRDPRDHRDRARQARQVPRRADHDGPRRRRQGDADADRGAARARASGGEALDALADAGAVAVDGTGLALTTDSFVVKPLRFPGGSIGELAVNGTVNDLAVAGRAAARADALARPRGGPGRRRRCAPRSRRSPRAARGGRRGGRRRRHEGRRARPRRRDVRLHDRPRAASTRARSSAPGRAARPATASSSRARSASTARRSCSPAASSSLERRHRVRHALAVAGGRRAARRRRAAPALHARRDPRRRRLGAQRARARLAAWRCSCARPPCRCAPAVAGARRAARHRPDVRRQRGQARRLRRARGAPTRRSPRCAPCPAASRRPRSARCAPSRPGWCCVETAFGGRRVMDQLVGDPLPRIC